MSRLTVPLLKRNDFFHSPFLLIHFALFILFLSLPFSLQAQTSPAYVTEGGTGTTEAATFRANISPSGTDTLLLLQVAIFDSAVSVTSATYNTTPFSLIRRDSDPPNGDSMETWYLVNPAVGTNTVTVIISASAYLDMAVLCYQYVNQTTPYGATTFYSNPANTTQTFTDNTLYYNSLIASMCMQGNTNPTVSIVAGTGQTRRWAQPMPKVSEGDEMPAPSPGTYFPTYALSSANTADYQGIEILSDNDTTSTNTPTPTPIITNTPTCSTSVLGSCWTESTANAAFRTRTGHSSVVFNPANGTQTGKMWVIGGQYGTAPSFLNDVYYSSNGDIWIPATANAAFSPRVGHASVVFNPSNGTATGRMWVIGGQLSSGAYANDAWYSTDGINWNPATPNAAFSGRWGMCSAVFNPVNGTASGKMWIIGGYTANGFANDVWYSSDGANWTQATANAPFTPRSWASALVYGGRLWVIGGSAATSDVWSTTDGVHWTLATSSPGFGFRYSDACMVYNGLMWVIGGTGLSSPENNDVWSSGDGANWTEATSSAPFPPRAGMSGVTFDNGSGPAMWVLGGWDGNLTTPYLNDVWHSNALPPTPTLTPTPTFTWTPTPTYTFSYTYTPTNTPTSTPTSTPTCSSSITGYCWSPATLNAAFPARNGHSSVVYNPSDGTQTGEMWVIGGGGNSGNAMNDAWYSPDGTNWSAATTNAAFSPRADHTSEVFNPADGTATGKMWVIGGLANATCQKDVWYSPDGANWSSATTNAAFPARFGHCGVVYNPADGTATGKMWVIGGWGLSGFLNDVWYSPDGVNWTEATASANFAARAFASAFVYAGKMWVAGGQGFEDVWSSSNGVSWTQVSQISAFGKKDSFPSLVYNGAMWLIGGQDWGTPSNDVWNSTDGNQWNEVNASAAFPPRDSNSAVVFNNRMWTLGGYTGSTALNDVWYTSMTVNTLTPTPTPPQQLAGWNLTADYVPSGFDGDINPWSVTTDGAYYIAVNDGDANGDIFVYDINGNSLYTITTNGGYLGNMALDTDGELYVPEYGTGVVGYILGPSGAVSDYTWNGEEDCVLPNSVRINGSGMNERLVIADDTGVWLLKWVDGTGSNIIPAGPGVYPQDAAMDSSGNFYVDNYLEPGTSITSYNSSYVSQGSFNGTGWAQVLGTYSAGIVVDSNNNLFISDWDNNRVVYASNTGAYSGEIDGGVLDFRNPSCLSFDPAGDLYAVDCGTTVVEEYKPGTADKIMNVVLGSKPTPTPAMTLTPTPNPTPPLPTSDSAAAWPNISQDGTPIQFRVMLTGQSTPIKLAIYSIVGELVYSADISGNPGLNEMEWDLRNNSGTPVATGVYIYRVQAGSRIFSGKVAVIH